MKKLVKVTIIVTTIIFGCYLSFYHYTDSYEFCITYNILNGDLKSDEHAGHHLSLPWVLATKIDTRPQRVCITSATRNMDCRLVQFDTTQWKELIKFEGFRYYWWYNRFSFNSGQETYRGVRNLLFGHSYGKTRGSFVKIIQEVGDEN